MREFIYGVLIASSVAAGGAAYAQAPQAAAAGNRQTALRQALNELIDARHQLQQDKSDTEGHREKAIGLIDAALQEVRAGLASDGHHF